MTRQTKRKTPTVLIVQRRTSKWALVAGVFAPGRPEVIPERPWMYELCYPRSFAAYLVAQYPDVLLHDA